MINKKAKNAMDLHLSNSKKSWLFILFILCIFNACSKKEKNFPEVFIDDYKNRADTYKNIIISLAINNNEKYMVAGLESGFADIWNIKNKTKKTIKAHNYRIQYISFTSDGESFFTNSSHEDMTNLWSSQTGELLHTVPNSRGPVCQTNDPNIYLIANRQGSGQIELFDLKNKSYLPVDFSLESGGVITAMEVSTPTNLVALGTASGDIEIWKLTLGGEYPLLEKMAGPQKILKDCWVQGLQFTNNEEGFYSVSRNGMIDEWSISPMKIKRTIKSSLNHIRSAKFFKKIETLVLSGTEQPQGMDCPIIEIFSFREETTATYHAYPNLSIVEYIPSFNAIIGGGYEQCQVIYLKD